MLFSEPKIPQSSDRCRAVALRAGFSALQRAENSSIVLLLRQRRAAARFSALQRAENSSIRPRRRRVAADAGFQCSSASRKFLNRRLACGSRVLEQVSVLFSEPKIPQFVTAFRRAVAGATFQCSSASRKFLNEPETELLYLWEPCFSALQRAENSSIWTE